MSPWMCIALGELGTAEHPGPADNPRVIAYHAATTLKATDDEVPWCSSFVNWTMRRADLAGTHSARALSWLGWGCSTAPQYGAIVVLTRGANPAQGHVGFWLDGDATRCWVLGGNQSDCVSVAPFDRDRVLGTRWPLGVDP